MKPAFLLALAAVLLHGQVHAATISLASTISGNSYMSEDAVTGSFARINLGNGSLGSVGANTGDADGVYNIANIGQENPGPLWGTPMDIFPRETNFQVGSLTYDDTGFTGVGVEQFSITALDLNAFWTSDPNRTNGTPGSAPTVLSDISDYAIGLWFFNGTGGISFGSLDAADTITFTNGVLTSIDLSISTSFSASFGTTLTWNGTFSISGADISYQINDTQPTFVGPSTFVANITGTVNAVPEPSAALLLSAGLGVLASRRTRRR